MIDKLIDLYMTSEWYIQIFWICAVSGITISVLECSRDIIVALLRVFTLPTEQKEKDE